MDEIDEVQRRLAAIPHPGALLAGLFALAPVGIQIYRTDGHCLLTNKAFRDLFGAEPPPQYNLFRDEVAEARGILDIMRRSFAGETITVPPVWYDPRELQHVHVTRGRRVCVSATSFPLFADDGRVSHVAIVFRDVTAEMHARQEAETRGTEAEAAQRRSAFLAEASVTLAESLDYRTTMGKVVQLAVPILADWCSVALADEAGVLQRVAVVHRDPAKAGLAQEYQHHFPPGEHRVGNLIIVQNTEEPLLMAEVTDHVLVAAAQGPEHLRLMRGLGTTSCMMVPMRVRGRSLGVISFMLGEGQRRYGPADLSLAQELAGRAALAVDNARLYEAERRAHAESERQILRLKEVEVQLQQAVRARDEFLSVASHELRTPLTALQLSLQSLLRTRQRHGATIDGEHLDRKLAVMDQQVQRLDRLIENLLDVSRVMAGRLSLELSDTDLGQVVQEAAARMQEQITRAGCTLVLHEKGPCLGRWDRLRLDQVITNLLSNACKYAPGHPIEVTYGADEKEVTLQVRDHGIGISEQDQARIFQRFQRAVSPTHHGGLGLGLWIVSQIVSALSGRVSVKSQPGEGAEFTVHLPRRPPQG